MATLTQIRDKANAKLAELWPVIQAKQDAYFAKHGKYFSLLATQEVTDGAGTTITAIYPHDEQHQADVQLTFDSPVPFQIRIDEWVRPNSAGYVATVWVKLLNGTIYTRSRDINDNDTGWSVFKPTII